MAKDVWGIPIPDAKDVVSYISSAMNTLSIASGDKPALTPGDNAVRRSGEAVSYLNSAINPFAETSKKLIGQAAGKPGANKALAKSVGVDVAVALTAALGGKAVAKGAQAFSDSRQMYYGIHGSPTTGLSKIVPQTGRNTEGFNRNVKGMLGADAQILSPKVFSYKPEPENIDAVTKYAQDAKIGSGSVYLVKTKAKNVKSNVVDTSKAASFMDSFAAQSLDREQMSSKTMKVIKEFPISNYTTKTYDAMEGGWDTVQKFSPLSDQIQQAIQSDKKNKLVRAIENTGIVPRVVNRATGRVVVVHGTGRPIAGKTINPAAGSAYSPDKPAAFVWNTEYAKGKDRGQEWIYSNVQEYANRPYYDPTTGKEVPGKGNIVIGTTKPKDAIPGLSSKSVIASTKPVQITKVFQNNPNLNSYENKEAFIKELKKAGVKTDPNIAKKLLDKAEAAKLARRSREKNKNSPV
jgi:hypothetical protein